MMMAMPSSTNCDAIDGASFSFNSAASTLAQADLAQIRVDIAITPLEAIDEALRLEGARVKEMVGLGLIDRAEAGDALYGGCLACGLVQQRGPDAVQKLLADILGSPSGTDTSFPSCAPDEGVIPNESGARRPHARILIELVTGNDVELFHTRDGVAFADIIINEHRETWPLKSDGFRRWLKRAYYMATGGAPNNDAMATAMGVMEAKANSTGNSVKSSWPTVEIGSTSIFATRNGVPSKSTARGGVLSTSRAFGFDGRGECCQSRTRSLTARSRISVISEIISMLMTTTRSCCLSLGSWRS